MINVFVLPGQLLAVAVTEIVALMAALLLFTAMNEGMLPFPFCARPILVSLFVQLYVVPFSGPVNVMAVEAWPLQRNWFSGCVTFALGRMVIVKSFGVPLQLFMEGITDMVAVLLTRSLLTGLNEGMSPVPLAINPIEGRLFVQL